MIAQADDIDDVMMRFEGGLLPTALLIDASYKLGEAAKKAPTITDVSVAQLYFASHQPFSSYK